jgi:ubiquinone/menaquinone biosynthesis C-methylase UbiE
MTKKVKSAVELHENVPPDWYHRSIKENAFQRFWHGRRFKEVKKLVEPVQGKILDIGSADGVFTKVILDNSKAKTIIGIDFLKLSVDWAEKHWEKNKRMKFKVGDAHRLEFKSNEFDAVYSLEVLEHVQDPKKVLKEVKRVLKKGGHAVFLVPAENLLFKVVWFFWRFYRGRIWKGTHLHKYSNDQLVELCKNVGFKVEESNKFLLNMLHVIKVKKK